HAPRSLYTLSLHAALPISIDGRDYVDGGVGFSGHADLAAEAGARLVIVVNPLVPNDGKTVAPLRSRGLYSIMEQRPRLRSGATEIGRAHVGTPVTWPTPMP